MQLMAAFYPYSQSFYGDLAQVKVAARRDSSAEENYRIKQLSQQVSGSMISTTPESVNYTFYANFVDILTGKPMWRV